MSSHTPTVQKEIIIDLDNGTATMINRSARIASEMHFPFTDQSLRYCRECYGANIALRSTGVQKTAGYQCIEYTGVGWIPTGDMRIIGSSPMRLVPILLCDDRPKRNREADERKSRTTRNTCHTLS
jgi:hypothetical protein